MNRFVLRTALILLGTAMGWSALQHWFPSSEIVAHYNEVGFGERGRIVIAALQSLAAVGLLLPRQQSLAAVVLAAVMSTIAVRSALVGGLLKASTPLVIAIWAGLPALGLWKNHKRAPGIE